MKSSIKSYTFLITFICCLFGHAYGTELNHGLPLTFVGNDTVTTQAKVDTLPDLVISKNIVEHSGRTDTYLVTKAMRENTHDAGDLIGKIDGMHYHPLSKELKYLGSGNVILLVDSIEKDSEYIKRLNPNRFLKINVTNNPSGRYAGYDAVINLVTKPTYEGYDGALLSEVNIRTGNRNKEGHPVSNWRDILEATYTRNDWNFAFSGNYSGAREGEGVMSRTSYPLNGYSQETPMPPLKDPNKFARQNSVSLKFWSDYRISNRHSISLGISAAPSSFNMSHESDIFTYINGELNDHELQKSRERNKDLLVLGAILQYRGKVGKWSLNAAAQYSSTTYDRLNSISRNNFNIDDFRHISSNFLWGGMDASRGFFKSKLILSLSDYATWIKYREEDYTTRQFLSSSNNFRNRFMASLQYSPSRNWSIGADAGLNIAHSGSGSIYSTHVTPRLGMNAMWTSSKIMVRLNYLASTRNVPLSQQQDFGTFTDSLIFREGNPDLSPALTHRINAMVNILRVFTISGQYTRTSNAIFEIATAGYGLRPDGNEGDFALFSYQNASSSSWKGNISFNKTFRKKWTLSLSASIRREEASFENLSEAKTIPEYDWYLMYNNNTYALQAYLSSSLQTSLVVTPQQLGWSQYDGYSLSVVKFLFSYKLQIVAMWRLPFRFIKDPYRSDFKSPAYVSYLSADSYLRSENQLALTLVWRFSGGKKTRKYDRQSESVDLFE